MDQYEDIRNLAEKDEERILAFYDQVRR